MQCIYYSQLGTTNGCEIKVCVKRIVFNCRRDKATQSEICHEEFRLDCKILSGSDEHNKGDEEGERNGWGKPSTKAEASRREMSCRIRREEQGPSLQ